MSDSQPLSRREQQVVSRVARGMANKDIAQELGITEGTVKVYVKVLLRKIRARNRTQLAIWYTGMETMNENEIKYVLRNPGPLEADLDGLSKAHYQGAIDGPMITCEDILQGYLTPNNRLRKTTARWTGETEYWFAYKQRLPNHHNLEIPCTLTDKVFENAWQHTIERLTKRRYKLSDAALTWDIDFYRWSRPHFAIAEVEMPEDMLEPPSIPEIIMPYVHFVVPRTDSRFTARLLASEDHVKTLARELGLLEGNE